MTDIDERASEQNSCHIGEGVIFKGSISAPDTVVVDGTVEGDITARAVRIGVSGLIRSTVPICDGRRGDLALELSPA